MTKQNKTKQKIDIKTYEHTKATSKAPYGTVTQKMTAWFVPKNGTNKSERDILASKVKFVVSDSSDWNREVYKDD